MDIDPRQLVRDAVVRDYRPVVDSIQVVRHKREGMDAVFAVAFEDGGGVQRRGALGLRRDGSSWHSCGRFMSSLRVAGDSDVWIAWGAWGSSDPRAREFCGGWVADPTAVRARLVDTAGRAIDDDIENGVALFFWTGDLNLRSARVELLDADGRITRSGPLYRGTGPATPHPGSLPGIGRQQPRG